MLDGRYHPMPNARRRREKATRKLKVTFRNCAAGDVIARAAWRKEMTWSVVTTIAKKDT